MMIDFASMVGAAQEDVTYDLEKFYAALDVTKSHTEPRTAQREAMQALTERKDERDLILKASTGAGKTTVGLLYLYGFMRMSNSPVVFLCPTNQLIDQVKEEAQRLGIKAHAYLAGEKHPHPECSRGEAIIICTYEKLFNAKSTFTRSDVQIIPNALVFDDAHAGVENIRKQFTLTITGDIYKKLLAILSPSIKSYKYTSWLDITQADPTALLEVPHWIWTDLSNEILELLHSQASTQDFMFVWPYLSDKLKLCRCVVSGSKIEISPEVLPTDQVRAFSNSAHRLFMSATLADDSVLTRELGIDFSATTNPIAPQSDRGLGERMILAPSLVDPSLDRAYVIQLAASLASTYNVVVLTSGGLQAADWVKAGATFYEDDTFAEGVRLLKSPQSGIKFAVFAQRFDGVDLPDEACRVLIIDGVPYGAGLIDKVDADMTVSPGGVRNRTIYRIEQGMGRPVRSHADFAVVLLAGQDLTTYVGRRDVLNAMTHDSRNQLNLGIEVAHLVRNQQTAGSTADAAIRQTIAQCLGRDAGWKAYYNNKIRSAPKEDNQIDESRIRLSEAERKAHAAAFQNSLIQAKDDFQKAIHDSGIVGEELGVYLQRLSRIAYLSDPVLGLAIQRTARQKNIALSIPPAMPAATATVGGKTVAEKVCAWIQKYSTHTAAVVEAKRIADALDFSQSYKKVESALKDLGEALGADSLRPDEDHSDGPDNIWFWGNNAFVIEAKNENEKTLHKKDSGQMHVSLEWAAKTYPAYAERLKPIVAARVSEADRQAHYPENTMVLTQAGCKAIGMALHQLMQKLAQQGPIFITPTNVLAEMHNFKLHPDQFVKNYTVAIARVS